jgi:hypothetical protein
VSFTPINSSNPGAGSVVGGAGSTAKVDPFGTFRTSLTGMDQQKLVQTLATLNPRIPQQGIKAGMILGMLGDQVKADVKKNGFSSRAGINLMSSASAWLQDRPNARDVLAALQGVVKTS